MPIEILPENYPDWVQFDSRDNIGFLGEDPFWQAKAGSSDPEQAILFRGGEGFLDRLIDGGKVWTSILPSIPFTPKWFDTSEMTWHDIYLFAPLPQPDPAITPPTKNDLTYHSYAGNPGHTGEHAVLASCVVTDGVDTGWDLAVMWYVYTYDDWATAKWQTIGQHMKETYATTSQGSSTIAKDITGIGTSPGWDSSFYPMVRLSSGKYALFYRYHSNNPTYKEYSGCVILSESGGTFSVDGGLDVDGGYGPHDPPFVHGTDVYFLRQVDAGTTPDRAVLQAFKWDCSGSAPVYDGLVDSYTVIDNIDSDYHVYNKALGFAITATGKIAVEFTVSPVSGVLDDYAEGYLVYFDCVTDTWSTPYMYASTTDWPNYTGMLGFNATGITIDGDLTFVARDYTTSNGKNLEMLTMTIGGSWTIVMLEQLVTDYVGGDQYTVQPYASVKLSNNRIAFNARNYGTAIVRYTGGGTITLIESTNPYKQFDYGEGHYGEWPMHEPIPGDKVFWGTNMDWSLEETGEPNSYFPHKLEPWSATTGSGVRVYVATRQYGRRFTSGSGLELSVAVVTVNDDKPASAEIGERCFTGSMAFTTDGESLWFPVIGREYTYIGGGSFLSTFELYTHGVYRNADGITGFLSYENWKVIGIEPDYWYGLVLHDDDITNAERLSATYYVNLATWPYNSAGIIVFGNFLKHISVSYLIQCYGNIDKDNFTRYYVWTEGVPNDPVGAVVYYNDRIYAILNTATGGELWESDIPPYVYPGNHMTHKSDTILDGTLRAMDVDARDGTIVIASNVADLLMVAATPVPYTVWYNLTLSHRNDRDVTGLIVL